MPEASEKELTDSTVAQAVGAAEFPDCLAAWQRGEVAVAEGGLLDIVRRSPDHADALHLLGLVARRNGDCQRAVECIRRSLAIDPRNPGAHRNLANALYDLGRLTEAIEAYDSALALRPGFAEAWIARAAALLRLDRPAEALASCDRAWACGLASPQADLLRGTALVELHRPAEALRSFDTVIARAPLAASAHNGRGAALIDLQDAAAALHSLERALALQPDLVDAWINRGIALAEMQRPEDAAASYLKAMVLRPDDARAHLNAAHLELRMGRFAAGWRHYEWRRCIADYGTSEAPGVPWTGSENLAGRSLLVRAEQGLGDTLQFCRYVRLLEARGALVIFMVQDALWWLMQGLASPSIRIVRASEAPPATDFHCPLLSVPRALGTTLETIPAGVPYLAAEAERVERWRSRLGHQGFRIGIGWQGGPSRIDAGRSFAVREFEVIARIPGVRLISLQKGLGLEQLDHLTGGMAVESPGHDFDTGPDAFLDSAAVMQSLDLVISSDTALAHLAGALGRPTWVALKCVPDWRWLIDREDSPWYPTMRLFRQSTPGDWAGVFASMRTALQSRLLA